MELEHLLSVEPGTGIIRRASPQFERLLGVPEGSLEGKHVLALRRCLTPETFADFVSNAAHDLVGPLNQASSLAGLLMTRHRDKLDENAAEAAAHLQSTARRMDVLVRAMRRYLEAVSTPPRLAGADASAAAQSALYLLAERIKACEARVECAPLPAVTADSGQLTTLFEILIDNALTFRDAVRAPEVHVSGERTGACVVFTIRDNGIGFSAADAERIFLPLVRLNGRRFPGAGMGLVIARAITDAHGGSIEAVPGNPGAAIRFTLRGPDDARATV
jgi:light-regulated signal transduction histidine kinase (bacteriophytochrome)